MCERSQKKHTLPEPLLILIRLFINLMCERSLKN